MTSLSCWLGRHVAVERGVRNHNHEFGRCDRCRRDLIRHGERWKPVPKGYRVVWKPRTGDVVGDQSAGVASVEREVTVRGVVVGERSYGAQRFALVRLNAEDERSYVDKPLSSGPASKQVKHGTHRSDFGSVSRTGNQEPHVQAPAVPTT
jgi:hypothetical protein